MTLADAPDSPAADDTIRRLRTSLDAVSSDALVGGATAVNLDVQVTAQRDNRVVIPLVLLVVFFVLMLLLRAVVAPLLLMATVVLSFLATLGVSAFFFTHVFGSRAQTARSRSSRSSSWWPWASTTTSS